ncbi:hypothetical protein L5515_006960 [Caenorhabditis briggsae]|uniref:Uncharacterized protein n=1 Tax=Caenorhabditis briggsae TaxID=6238 RepID=A0AAE9JIT3_CAEBR|nr:hypothetical protein L5515_006960 [Caenorhabditis briggsae]
MKSVQDSIDTIKALSESLPPEDVLRLSDIRHEVMTVGEIFGIFGRVALDKKQTSKTGSSKTEKKVEAVSKEMTFEEKRKLFQAEFPNKVSPERRARARDILNSIAQNLHEYLPNPALSASSEPQVTANGSIDLKSTPVSSTAPETEFLPSVDNRNTSFFSLEHIFPEVRLVGDGKPMPPTRVPVQPQLLTSRSWPSSTDSEESILALTAPRVKSSVFENVPQEVNSRFNGTFKFGNHDNFSKMSYDAAYSNDTQSESVNTVYEGTVGTPLMYDSELGTPLLTCVE